MNNNLINPKVSIVILNWNGWRDTIECLESIYHITYPNYDVIILDNASEDNSVDMIRDYCSSNITDKSAFSEEFFQKKPINVLTYINNGTEVNFDQKKEDEFLDLPANRKLRLIINNKNHGFAEGNNIGIMYAKKAINPDYIMLLNNDTIVDTHFLGRLINTGNEHQNAGIIAPIIFTYDKPKQIQSAGLKLIWYLGSVSPLKSYSFTNPKQVDFVSGCAMLIRNQCSSQLTLFNPYFFAYWEDIELCHRIKTLGYEIIIDQESKIWHKSHLDKLPNSNREFYGARNLFVFMKKYLNRWRFCIFLLGFFFVQFWIYLALIMKLYKQKKIAMMIAFSRGVFIGLKTSLTSTLI